MTASLDAIWIKRALDSDAGSPVDSVVVFDTVPSTNSWLMEHASHEPGHFQVALAEQQTAGRGRRGNRWLSPRGAGLYLSIAHTFTKTPGDLSGLTLAAGVAVVQALENLGATGIKLKWPNDIYAGNAKLGGILTDAQTAAGSRTLVVCGIGINIDLSLANENRDELRDLEYPITDLAGHCTALADRSSIAASIIERVTDAFATFEQQGLAPFLGRWNACDWLKGQAIEVDMPDSLVAGIADGVDATGALRVDDDGNIHRVVAGTVRLRQASHA